MLGVLKSALVLSDPQELSNTLLVWSEAGDLLHDLSHELDPVREALIFKKKKGELVGQHLHRDITWSFRNDTLQHPGEGGGKKSLFFFSLSSLRESPGVWRSAASSDRTTLGLLPSKRSRHLAFPRSLSTDGLGSPSDRTLESE